VNLELEDFVPMNLYISFLEVIGKALIVLVLAFLAWKVEANGIEIPYRHQVYLSKEA